MNEHRDRTATRLLKKSGMRTKIRYIHRSVASKFLSKIFYGLWESSSEQVCVLDPRPQAQSLVATINYNFEALIVIKDHEISHFTSNESRKANIITSIFVKRSLERGTCRNNNLKGGYLSTLRSPSLSNRKSKVLPATGDIAPGDQSPIHPKHRLHRLIQR